MDFRTAQKNAAVVKQIVDVYRLSRNAVKSGKISDLENRNLWDSQQSVLEQILDECSLIDLRVIYAIASIGYHERGIRHRYLNNGDESVEIIEMAITENEEELLSKHSKYIAFLSEQELREQLLARIDMSQDLIEGMKIIKLS
ncbi:MULTISPECIES: hypothetical protein [unclassified Paenibacillus]|uniref:hypothetical protein n=1 Tax=unclassified Paenibacillus TaxID=185978 RepID=UPI00089B2862|nr:MULTISPECIES: hypothetical protein [unclassified Paenibacillus]OMC67284.1 hypothetical protein BK126_16895 [Paenibacillus sp. FSL H7-0326]SDW69382.1 hypothetical protein SAMN05518848_102709 [Paenibacillus sp. PDC88]